MKKWKVKALVTQLYLTLCDPTDSSPPGSSVHGDSPGKHTGLGCHGLLQEIFPTQGLNPGLPHCRHILYHLSQHKPRPGPLFYVSTSYTEVISDNSTPNTHTHTHTHTHTRRLCRVISSLSLYALNIMSGHSHFSVFIDWICWSIHVKATGSGQGHKWKLQESFPTGEGG